MEEEIKMYLDEARELMEKAVQHTQREFTKIRAGKASTEMLNGILVDYYGVMTPIAQVAGINTPDARTIAIKPFEKSMIGKIEKSIKDSDLGIQPNNDGELIRLSIPPLTEERRQKLVKQVKQEGEAGKVSVRNIRKDTNSSLKDLQKEGASEDAIKKAEEKVQKFTDEFIVKVDEIVGKKETELMTV
ncbi:MAG: ribosome recycling factor [Bacteroidetes bacterium]|nr:MAG: ribosome recycling factor [Bacteroidota bacterium]TAG85790.1 MAG: ribosome recycling factor [Bacteroidota bacterium]